MGQFGSRQSEYSSNIQVVSIPVSYLRFPVFCAPHTIFFAASSSLGIGGIDIEIAKLPMSEFLTDESERGTGTSRTRST
jgi:hypothetical protein